MLLYHKCIAYSYFPVSVALSAPSGIMPKKVKLSARAVMNVNSRISGGLCVFVIFFTWLS